ncbi:hypothetical protein [Burkholderia orbicola]|uniref:hypothetical protein n=1 Tax=Burkholderia orbicola TaxID=2978683 RepID=UPI00264C50B2|nr:hypothetical protein [Burkholderia orbicola]MDN7582955.1 hypothetical protein [Burkholderia orbicola]
MLESLVRLDQNTTFDELLPGGRLLAIGHAGLSLDFLDGLVDAKFGCGLIMPVENLAEEQDGVDAAEVLHKTRVVGNGMPEVEQVIGGSHQCLDRRKKS